jgi:hypothetical protein
MIPLAWAFRNSDQVGPVRLGGRTEARLSSEHPDRRGPHPDGQPAELALDTHGPPARVLSGETQDQFTDLGVDRRSPRVPPPSVRPLPPHQLAVPSQDRLRGHDERDPSLPRKDPTRRGHHRAVKRPEPGSACLALQDPDPMLQDQDFQVSRATVASSESEQAGRDLHDEVEEKEHRGMVEEPLVEHRIRVSDPYERDTRIAGWMKRKKLASVGTLFEIDTSRGFAYVQLALRHPVMGCLIRVLPAVFEEPPSDLQSLVQQKERFFTFYPVDDAVARGLIRPVATLDLPEWAREMPLLRKALTIDPVTRRPAEWALWDGTRTIRAEMPSSELRELSLARIVSHDLLVKRIEDDWSPAVEFWEAPDTNSGNTTGADARRSKKPSGSATKDDDVLRQLEELGFPPGSKVHVRHYLYFNSAREAKQAASRIRKLGFDVEQRPSGRSTLVRASHALRIDPSSLERLRAELGEIAERSGGEYDGWEASFPGSQRSEQPE